ncbi:alpha/beta fold hydrolase [Acuticoccus mangrovi]|uniref:Alpha/beta hydrolase n=1 Tax=Acuticoccus mangrovi TaxID=2796142 RepID=A0A934IU77_9HYPH|nr:alpha/beta hydrolase [Acuticoccus mangrovi]MBJ3778125.1 alpha/beta hydrolase [Acuticoccus mangrovi]
MTIAFEEGIVDGPVPLRYVRTGPKGAPVLVCLHGLRAYAHWFDEFTEVAAGDFDVIALDQRGRGGSGKAPDGDYTTAAYVADVTRLLDALAIDTATLVGHSMGGTNAINFAARHPERMDRLVIVDSAPVLAAPGLERMRSEMGRTPAAFPDRAAAEAFLGGLHARATARSLKIRLKWMVEDLADGSVGWRIDKAIFDPRMTPDPAEKTWDALKAIRCPTLIVRGGISDMITAEIVEEMAAVMADARVVEVADAGHMVIEENPEGFNAAVLPFVREMMLA